MPDSAKETKEEKPADGKETEVSILTAGIGTRVKEISKRVGGNRSLSEMIGLSEAQLYRIISESSQPKLEVAAAIAKAGGVSIDWLATGAERPNAAASSAGATQYVVREGFSPEDVGLIVRSIERHPKTTGLDAEGKAVYAKIVAELEFERRAEGRRQALEMLKEGPPQAED